MAHIRTVLGDVPAATFGPTDYHEHLFQVSPLLPADELTDERLSSIEASSLRTSGIASMVEATPTGLGRNPAALARISAAVDLNVVATTGAHRQAHYGEEHWLFTLDVEALCRRFGDEVAIGIPTSDQVANAPIAQTPTGNAVRAGIIKAGIGYWSISAFEQRVLEAVARAALETGAPVMVHLEYGSAAFEVVEILGTQGLAPDRIVLAHIDRNPDPGLHAELAAMGCYLGYDGMARAREWPDSVLIACLVAAAKSGAAERIVLGGDVARATRYVAYGGMPGLRYLAARFVPRLREAAGDDLVHRILELNIAKFLTLRGSVRRQESTR